MSEPAAVYTTDLHRVVGYDQVALGQHAAHPAAHEDGS